MHYIIYHIFDFKIWISKLNTDVKEINWKNISLSNIVVVRPATNQSSVFGRNQTLQSTILNIKPLISNLLYADSLHYNSAVCTINEEKKFSQSMFWSLGWREAIKGDF